VTPGSGGAR